MVSLSTAAHGEDRLITLRSSANSWRSRWTLVQVRGDFAALAAQLRAVLTEIDELAPGELVSPADEILRRRTERQRQAKGRRRSRAV